MSKPQDFLSQLEADATDSTTAPQDSELNKVAVLAKKIQAKQSRLSLLEGEIKQLKQELLQLTDEDLPATMQELGLSAFTTDDGEKTRLQTNLLLLQKIAGIARSRRQKFIRKHSKRGCVNKRKREKVFLQFLEPTWALEQR